jgi:protein-S-isoprenylcysteine O-methyltransferase Ste14
MPPSAENKMWTSLVVGFVVIGLALFAAAGTACYWQAWVYLAVGVVMSVVVTLRIVRDPVLLASRLDAGPTAERRPIQRLIIACLAVPLVAVFIVPPLDHRFGWSHVPAWLCIAGDGLIVASMLGVDQVFKANSFGRATVEVTADQRVISTGPYAIVRNPMYACAALYFVGLVLALGSYWALVAAALGTLGFVWRLFDEEALLTRELPGYVEYCAKVRWHLVPYVF